MNMKHFLKLISACDHVKKIKKNNQSQSKYITSNKYLKTTLAVMIFLYDLELAE